jgi:polyisoprenoid-binding protein YceI
MEYRVMPSSNRIILRSALAFVVAIALPAFAIGNWQLQPEESSLAFVSVKNGSVAEAHSFTDLSGGVDDDGARVVVELASVETSIPIRNDRMREFLFEISDHPQAVFTTSMHAQSVDDLAPGQSRRIEVTGSLELHGEQQQLSASVQITRAGYDRMVLSTVKPILISADAFALGDGITRLKEIAGLGSITPMVPVTFSLTFARED